MTRFRDVLRNKNFLLLWLAQVISNFGDRLNQMALVALVYQRTPGSVMELAKLISLTIIPVFVIGPVAGAWVDRLDRRNVMVISDVLRGILVFMIPFCIMANQIVPLYIIVFLTFSLSRFFIPSKMAIIPELVSKEKLLVANTLSDTTHMIGNIVGLVVAGIIVNIRYIGAIGGFYIDAVSFFVSAALITMIAERELVKGVRRDLEATKEALGRSLRRSIFREIKEGIGYLTGQSAMRFIVYVFFLLMAGLGTISCVIIVFIQEAFATATRDLGFLAMFFVGGLFAGTVLYGRFAQRVEKRRAVRVSFIASGIAIILFALCVRAYPNLILAGLAAGFLGAAASPIMISTTTLTHETIPEDARGRVFSSLEAVMHLAFLVFMFAAAFGAKYIDRFWIVCGVGIVFAVCGLFGVIGSRRAGERAT